MSRNMLTYYYIFKNHEQPTPLPPSITFYFLAISFTHHINIHCALALGKRMNGGSSQFNVSAQLEMISSTF